MASKSSLLAWDDLRYLLVVARTGSANRAAEQLGTDHTTVGRRLRALEQRLGVRLFERSPGASLTLTADGLTAMEEAERMERASENVVRKLAGADRKVAGEVRVAASDGITMYWLMPALNSFRAAHPGLKVTWISMNSNHVEIGRDADIALRWSRPVAPGLVGRRLGSVDSHLYAGDEYERKHGFPRSVCELKEHALVHFAFYESIPALGPWNHLMNGKLQPAMRLESSPSAAPLMDSGDYIFLLPSYTPIVMPTACRLPFDMSFETELWMICREDQREQARVRMVMTEIGRLAHAARGKWFKA